MYPLYMFWYRLPETTTGESLETNVNAQLNTMDATDIFQLRNAAQKLVDECNIRLRNTPFENR